MEHVLLWNGGASFGYLPKSGIAGSSGRTISRFLRNIQVDFKIRSISLQSHQQWSNVPFSPHPCQHVLPSEVLILAILIGVRWNLRIILINISLITKDFYHFFMWFSTIRDSSLAFSQFSSISHVLIGLFGFFGWWLSSWVLYICWILALCWMWS